MKSNVANLFYNGSTVPNHNVNPQMSGILWENKKSNTQPYVCLDNTLNRNIWEPINNPKLSALENYTSNPSLPSSPSSPRNPITAINVMHCYNNMTNGGGDPQTKTFDRVRSGVWSFFTYITLQNNGRSSQGVYTYVNDTVIGGDTSYGRDDRKWVFMFKKVVISGGSCVISARYPEGSKNYGTLSYIDWCVFGYARNIAYPERYANAFGMSKINVKGPGNYPGNRV